MNKNEIKEFILSKQLLLPSRSLKGLEGIKTVFEKLRSLQFDPQNLCGNSIDISLQARVKGIHSKDYYYWLYNKKELIEAYDKELSVVPIKDLNLTGFNMPEHRTKKIN
ncbi:MAG: hypothetical protein ABH821_04590, partial [archaeon]